MNLKKSVAFLFVVSALLLHYSCNDEEKKISISSFEPTSGDYGTKVLIRGFNFETEQNQMTIKFGTARAEVAPLSSTQLEVIVPGGGSSGPITIERRGHITSTKEIFTINSGTWIPNGNFGHATTISANAMNSVWFVLDEKVYIYGGRTNSAEASFWSYDPVSRLSVRSNEFSKSFSATGKTWATSSKGYIFSGYDLWEYDQAVGNWSLKSSPAAFPKSGNPLVSFYLPATEHAYVIASDGTVWVYSVSNDTWGRLPDFPFGHVSSNSKVASSSSKGYILSDTNFWQFDSNTLSWVELKKYPGHSCNFMFVINDNVYAGSTNVGRNPELGLWKYDEIKNEWILKASPPAEKISPLYFSIGQKGYVGMGNLPQGSNTYVYDIIEYTPD